MTPDSSVMRKTEREKNMSIYSFYTVHGFIDLYHIFPLRTDFFSLSVIILDLVDFPPLYSAHSLAFVVSKKG